MSNVSWYHFNPVNINFGRGRRSELLPILGGRKCLIVTSYGGRQRLAADPILSRALEVSRHNWVDGIKSNPDMRELQNVIDSLAGAKIEVIVAVGGGSVIDGAKVLAVALSPRANGLALRELIDVGSDFPFGMAVPLFAVPTTAGTGSEVTPFATIWDYEKKQKMSLSGPAVYPHGAIVDPELTDSLPYDITCSSGLDAVNQAAESIWNKSMTPVSEAYAQQALRLGFEALPKLLDNLESKTARDAMAHASVLAGLAISQTRTALCHAISYPLTAHFGIPHGFACAFPMIEVLRHNLVSGDSRFERLARTLGHSTDTSTENLLMRFESLLSATRVRAHIKQQVAELHQIIHLIDEMFTPGRADNNLVPADREIVRNILVSSWK